MMTTTIEIEITGPDEEGTYTARVADGGYDFVEGYGASPAAAMADLLLDLGRAIAGGLIDELSGGWAPDAGPLPGNVLRFPPKGEA